MARENRHKHNVLSIQANKEGGARIAIVTAYDATQSAIAEAAGVDVILVGDSVGMVVLGHETTIPVTLDDMIHHARAVRRGAPATMAIVDMPFLTYHADIPDTLYKAGRVMQETGADGVKLEGGRHIAPQVAALVAAGIPVCGHLGLTPQSYHQFGGFRVQARSAEAAQALLEDALALEAAGAFLLVLECIPAPVAATVTARLRIPTIGIGAGPSCDGQVLVYHDLLGLRDARPAKFVKPYAHLHGQAVDAIASYCREVREGLFPDAGHSYNADEKAHGQAGEGGRA